jgi:hypothetical protein
MLCGFAQRPGAQCPRIRDEVRPTSSSYIAGIPPSSKLDERPFFDERTPVGYM